MKQSPARLLKFPAIVWFAASLQAVEVDPNFNAQVNGTVHSIALAAEGKILVGGEFPELNGVAVSNLVRLQANGNLDSNFSVAVDGSVFALGLAADGSIYTGGAFNSPIRHFAQFTESGQLDNRLNLGTGPNSRVNRLVVLPDGAVFFAGRFQKVNDVEFNYAGKLRAEGTPEFGFVPALQPTFSLEAGITAMAVQSDGKVLLGGNMTTADGFESLVRLNADGSLDPTFSRDNGPILYPKVLLLLPDDRIALAGVANSNGEGFVRVLNPDGSVDPGFLEASFDGAVETIALGADGKIIAGGDFTGKLARLEANGTLDVNWDVTCDGTVKTIVVENSGHLLVGGAFRKVGGADHRGLARLIVSRREHGVLNATNENGLFIARLRAEPGKLYRIEASTDLRIWTDVASATASTVGVEISDADARTRKHRFFRIRAMN